MPVTPFHFGPGLLIKGAAPRAVSWTGFCAANVLVDFESAYHMLQRHYPVHRAAHTFLLAPLVGLAAGAILAAARKAVPKKLPPSLELDLGRKALLWGGFLGGLTHPLLDGIMHPDIRPFAPFSQANPLLDLVGLGELHLFCVAAGLVGLCLLSWRRSLS